MAVRIGLTAGPMMLAEIEEFGSFPLEVQRYVCRSLDVAFFPQVSPAEWARNAGEADDIQAQKQVYRLLPGIHASIPDDDTSIDAEAFLFPLIAVTTFDVSCSCFGSFAQYRFLYERLLGARVRPWLPPAFSAVAALPHFRPDERRALVASATSALAGSWSVLEPTFYPEWLGDREMAPA